MQELRRVLIILTLVAATRYANAFESDDPDLLLSHQVFQQLSARLSAIEEQSKFQQHRITELESREIALQKQVKLQQHHIGELKSRNIDQQNAITELKGTIRDQQNQIKELNRSFTETNQACHNHQDDVLTPQNEETIENDKGETNNRILTRRQQPEIDNVAFTAILLHARNDLGLDQNVVFDLVETNIGNAYNPHHGVFTAPVAGTYVFHVSVFSLNTDEAWCKMVVNGVHKVHVYARGDTNHHDQGSQMLVIRLNQGDDVAIQNGRAHDSVFGNGDLWTTFSGFLLRTDADVTTILG